MKHILQKHDPTPVHKSTQIKTEVFNKASEECMSARRRDVEIKTHQFLLFKCHHSKICRRKESIHLTASNKSFLNAKTFHFLILFSNLKFL